MIISYRDTIISFLNVKAANVKYHLSSFKEATKDTS